MQLGWCQQVMPKPSTVRPVLCGTRENHTMFGFGLPLFLLLIAVGADGMAQVPAASESKQPTAGQDTPSTLWDRDNLVAWCIVPFDAARRGPVERAAMLDELGIRRLAYDYQ